MGSSERYKNILNDGILIAQIFNFNTEGEVIFPSPESQEMQCGFGKGEMHVTFLNEQGLVVTNEIIRPGNAFLQFVGGHKIKFMANTRYFEIKQGPYLGNQKDKFLIQ